MSDNLSAQSANRAVGAVVQGNIAKNVSIQTLRSNWDLDPKTWLPEGLHFESPEPESWPQDFLAKLAELSELAGASGHSNAIVLLEQGAQSRFKKLTTSLVGKQFPTSRDIRYALDEYRTIYGDKTEAQGASAQQPSNMATEPEQKDHPYYGFAVHRAYANGGIRGAAFGRPELGATIMTPETAQLGKDADFRNSDGPFLTTRQQYKRAYFAKQNEDAIMGLEEHFGASMATILQDPNIHATEILRLAVDISERLWEIVRDNRITSLTAFHSILQRKIRRNVAGKRKTLSTAVVRQLQVDIIRDMQEINEQLDEAKREGKKLIVKLKVPSASRQHSPDTSSHGGNQTGVVADPEDGVANTLPGSLTVSGSAGLQPEVPVGITQDEEASDHHTADANGDIAMADTADDNDKDPVDGADNTPHENDKDSADGADNTPHDDNEDPVEGADNAPHGVRRQRSSSGSSSTSFRPSQRRRLHLNANYGENAPTARATLVDNLYLAIENLKDRENAAERTAATLQARVQELEGRAHLQSIASQASMAAAEREKTLAHEVILVLKEQAKAADEEKAAAEKDEAGAQREAAALKDQLQTAEQEVATLKARLQTAEEQQVIAEQAKTDAQQEVITLKAQLQVLEEQKVVTEQKTTGVQQEITMLKTRLQTAEEQKAVAEHGVQQEVAALKAQLQAAEEQTAVFKQAKTDAHQDMAAQEARIYELEQQVATIDAQIHTAVHKAKHEANAQHQEEVDILNDQLRAAREARDAAVTGAASSAASETGAASSAASETEEQTSTRDKDITARVMQDAGLLQQNSIASMSAANQQQQSTNATLATTVQTLTATNAGQLQMIAQLQQRNQELAEENARLFKDMPFARQIADTQKAFETEHRKLYGLPRP